MPVYEYRCKSCGTTHEIQHGFNDPRPTTCPSCGGELVRVFHPIGVLFKGSGFHKTDYAKSGLKPESASGESSTGDSKPSDAPAASSGSDSGSSKPASGESKPSPTPKPESKPAAPTPKTGT